MSASSVSLGTQLRYGGFYLPAAAFGYVSLISDTYLKIPYLDVEVGMYLLLAVISVFAATIVYDIFHSVLGPTNVEPIAKSKATVLQRLLYAIFNEGRPSYYGNLGELLRLIEISGKRALIVGTASACTLSLLILYPYSVIVLFQHVDPSNLLPTGLLFVQVIWAVRFLTPSWWPNVYILDYRNTPKIEEDVEEFAMVLISSNIIGEYEYKYQTKEGGELLLQYESLAENEEDERVVFEQIFTAYAGTVAKGDYPCRRLNATVIESGESVAEYKVGSMKARAYADGELEFERLLSIVINELEFLTQKSRENESEKPIEVTQ